MLDLNGPSSVFLRLIGLFVVVIPGLLGAYSLVRAVFLPGDGDQSAGILPLVGWSLVCGAVVLAVLLMLVVVEQVQDRAFDVAYRRNRGRRARSFGKYSECQYCGNRRVADFETSCGVCGKRLL